MKKETITHQDTVCSYCGYPFNLGDTAIYDDVDGSWYCCVNCSTHDMTTRGEI